MRDARKSVHLTQRELGKRLTRPVSDQQVSDMENGRARITERTAAEVERITNATPGFILTGEGYLTGGAPSPAEPSGVELDLLRRVADLERELAALRDQVEETHRISAGKFAASRTASKVAAEAGRAARQAGKRRA